MNKRQENKLTMYEGLLALLQDNGDRIRSINGFADSVAKLSGIMDEIKTKSIEVDEAAAGKTSGKYSAQDALIECLLPVCSALYLFGRKESSNKIMERASTTESRLRNLRDSELATYGSAMAEMAAENAQGISAIGISTEKIEELKSKAEAYTSSIGARESSIADRKGARETMNGLFGKADELINEEIDHYIELIRPSETEFYNKYYAARVIKDIGIRHRHDEPVSAATAAE